MVFFLQPYSCPSLQLSVRHSASGSSLPSNSLPPNIWHKFNNTPTPLLSLHLLPPPPLSLSLAFSLLPSVCERWLP